MGRCVALVSYGVTLRGVFIAVYEFVTLFGWFAPRDYGKAIGFSSDGFGVKVCFLVCLRVDFVVIYVYNNCVV